MALILEAINDGMGLKAAGRTFHIGKNSLKRWISRLGDLKERLLLYALCHQFIQQVVEGDELYTKMDQNKPALASEGWTVVFDGSSQPLHPGVEMGSTGNRFVSASDGNSGSGD